MANFFAPIGWVVIFALICSVIESQLILPSHLANRDRTEPKLKAAIKWNKFQGSLADGLERFSNNYYMPFVRKTISWRYATAAICLGVLILALALIASGRAVFGFFPAIEGDRVYAGIEMPEGIAAETTLKVARKIEEASRRLNIEMSEELGLTSPLVRNALSSVGQKVDRNGPGEPQGAGRSNIAEIVIDLAPLKERNYVSAKTIANRWREYAGSIPGVVKLSFDADNYSAGAPIEYQLNGDDVDELRRAAEDMKAQLSRFTGVFDIADSFRSGKQEIQLELLPEARNLGLTLRDLALQVRSSFYGSEAQRVQRGQDDIRVMVRFPESERKSLGNLEDMYIRTPDGNQVPFYSVARFDVSRGYSKINRKNGRRQVVVSADVNRSIVSPEEVSAAIREELIPEFRKRYPNIDVELGGEQEERADALGGLAIGSLFSLVVIYGLLAIPLRSYLQPLVIMSVIPFGAVGAIVGHFLLNEQLMFFSALGIVALSGVVVNASLVLVDYANRKRREGVDMVEAILEATAIRFRPILLTSVTTFIGLIPLMSTSTPATAPFLPMAISLAWGVLFATFITLLLVPCLYLIVEDFLAQKNAAQLWLKGGLPTTNDATLQESRRA
jgi:multidrug efflux pump subunit AcrB